VYPVEDLSIQVARRATEDRRNLLRGWQMAIADESRNRAIQIARNMVEGRIGALEATRALLPFLHADPSLAIPEDLTTLKGIDSETDDLPVGRIREEWHPDRLHEKDKEIARCEKLYGQQVRSICERLLQS
jgi:hypothetical protein